MKIMSDTDEYLYKNFNDFVRYTAEYNGDASGLIAAHSDKCYQYRDYWEQEDICFNHGSMLYLLSYLPPFSNEVDRSKIKQWVVRNYINYMHLLPE